MTLVDERVCDGKKFIYSMDTLSLTSNALANNEILDIAPTVGVYVIPVVTYAIQYPF